MIGRDYMRNVQTSLDRAALATVVLLLGVLLLVYRSFLLALVPLATIGMCVIISRGVLAWLATVGWEISPLVELFLIVLLFGSGTDFCLFVSWRFGEHWDARNPAAAMRVTLRRGADRPDDQRRDGLRRPDADGDDQVQALLQHRPERGPGPGDHPGRQPHAGPGLAGPARAVAAEVVPRDDRAFVGLLGPVRPPGPGPAVLASWSIGAWP